jgi:nucleotide-binding universal stress UspA family protein
MIKSLVVGVAGTPALPAKIEFAIDLARRHGAEISVLSVVDVDRLAHVGPVPMGAEKFAQDMRRRHVEHSHELDENAIATFEAACTAAQVPLRVIRLEGDPLDALAATWRYNDLCVLGARGWFDYDVVAEPQDALLKLIASGVRPILAVTSPARPIRRALIAYNGSLQSAKAMKRFIQMALWPDLELHIACVGTPKTGEDPQVLLEQAASYCRLYGYAPVTTQLAGKARNALLDHAAAIEADVIVLGSSYRRMLLRQRFGRNAIALIKNSEIPLFLSH